MTMDGLKMCIRDRLNPSGFVKLERRPIKGALSIKKEAVFWGCFLVLSSKKKEKLAECS